MMKLLKLRFGRRLARVIGARDDDRGMALATVIIMGAVLLLMSVTVVSVSVSGNTRAQTDADWVAAGQAAYAGVEDYQSKLANDNSYSQYGSTASTFSAGSTFTSANNNPAFGYGTSGTTNTWQTVDPNNAAAGTYRYQVDNSSYSTSGVLRLQSTGRVGHTTRTVIANLKQSGFLDYLYFTDEEIIDPALTPGCQANTSTPVPYAWQTGRSASCSSIQFAAADVLNGPVHSNDSINICGSTFNNVVTTSKPAGGYITPSGCTSTPTFAKGAPTYTPVIQMPATITSLSQETRTDLKTSTVPRPGCLYTGPTTFTLNGDGTWTIYSPWTQFTNITGATTPVGDNSQSAMCGTAGYSASGNTLGSPNGQTLTVIPNNLVYVQDVPATGANSIAGANAASPKTFVNNLPSHYTCTGADGTTSGDGVGYPAVTETAPTSTSYGCQSGDAFVSDEYDANGNDIGGFGGNATIAASNYVYVTGDITYDTPTTDLLGLIGQNNVYVYNPIGNYTTYTTTTSTKTTSCPTLLNLLKTCTTTTTTQVPTTHTNALLDETADGRTVDAAIMSVAHSFAVENYSADSGHPKGTLSVLGSIIQKYRGTVATSGTGGTIATGYAKNYLYDQRLAYEAPPKFLSPVSTTYGISQITETKTAISATGAPLT